jgi:hypothetical protein
VDCCSKISVGEVLVDFMGAAHGTFFRCIRSLISGDAGVTQAPGEDHLFPEGALEGMDFNEDTEDDGVSGTWVLKGFKAAEGVGGDKDDWCVGTGCEV